MSVPGCSASRRNSRCCWGVRSSYDRSNAAVTDRFSAASSSSRSTAAARSAPSPATVQAGWWYSCRASIPIAKGRQPHSRVISRTAGSAELSPGRTASRTSSPAASPGGRASRLIVWVSSSAVSRRRLVIRTRLPPSPGSSGRICSLLAASSSTSSSCRPASRSRHSPVRASRSAGICPAGIPMVSSRLASASAGSTGCCPGVCPCKGTKICPPGNRPASRCAAWTANAVLPMPAIPPIAWMLTTPPAPAAASASSASSCRRPVNEAMSRGSVRAAAATPLAPARPVAVWPRAAASNSIRSWLLSWSASASSRTVSWRGVATMPRSRSLTARGLTPAASASSSCVSPATARSRRSTPANPAGGSATTSPLAPTAHSTQTIRGRLGPLQPAPAGRKVRSPPAQLGAPDWTQGRAVSRYLRARRSQFPRFQFCERDFMFMARSRCLARSTNGFRYRTS